MRILLLATLTVSYVATPASAGAAWRSPLPQTDVVGHFDYDRTTPFAPGRRRGVDLRARPGEPVRAACAGTVLFAGSLPGGGRGVTIACGSLAATELGLGRVAVARGRRLARGEVVGTAGPGAVVRLGARRRGDRFGYLDPLALIAGPGPPTVAPVAPRTRAPRTGRPLPAPAPVAARSPVPASPAPGVGIGVLAGGVLLLAGAGIGGVAGARRRRLRRRRPSPPDGAPVEPTRPVARTPVA